MSTTCACGRADLVRALASGNADILAATAQLLGFTRQDTARLAGGGVIEPADSASLLVDVEPRLEDVVERRSLTATPFWRVEAFETVSEGVLEEAPVDTVDVTWTNRPSDAPMIHLLAPWRELQPRLRREATEARETQDVDVTAMVRRLSQGRLLKRVPRERRRRWGPRLQLVVDRSERLVPFWTDQEVVAGALSRLVPEHTLEQAAFWEGLSEPRIYVEPQGAQPYRLPPPGSLVLVLGDLGCLSAGDPLPRRIWLDLGRRLADAGSRAVALVPGPPARFSGDLSQYWQMLPWGRSRGPATADRAVLRQRAERLLRLVSPAVRIEPGFLRAVRLLLPLEEADAATEADVWQHPAITSTCADGATLDPKEAVSLRDAFARDAEHDPELHRKVLALLRVWRGHLPQEIWFEEIQCLAPVARDLLPEPADLEFARRFFEQLSQRARGIAPGGVAGGALSWYRRCERRLTPSAWTDGIIGATLHKLSWALHGEEAEFRPGAGFDPAMVPPTRERRLAIRQQGAVLVVGERPHRGADEAGKGSPLAWLRSGNGLLQIAAGIGERGAAFWETGEPPPWADDWGWDDYGAWVTFLVKDKHGKRVTQRLRWIAPGRFVMGSPQDEPARYDDEGPQHEVTIEAGYWLFDTACTQALWEAVMGDNPSHFKGPDRPVEKVSWNDAQRFIERLNTALSGLALGLPSEAQWEYACRAGTDTPFSFGANTTPEQVNYNGEYPYAEGKKGANRGETVPVKGLPANPWGLYEMHGNVLEWVQDTWHGNYEGAPADGAARETHKPGADRVLRGGSWSSFARYCRSAYRDRRHPDFRNGILGFRCARVQVREPGRQGAERANLARPGPRSGLGRAATGSSRAAGGGAEGGTAGGADDLSPEARGGYGASEPPVLLRLESAAEATAPLPRAPLILIRTDREHLSLRRITTPHWASAIGRDRFGLWTEMAIEPTVGEPVIQRLRWIAPGRFVMGSPKGEPGRSHAEGSQHEVVIGQGYWLFDSPCTQALWEALLGENPSRFQDPDRPVEQVSWDDVEKRFLPALNARIPGFSLPSEAQWEHACRAGTQTALYTGGIEILGDMDAPALDSIAWYSGNSGVGYDLAEGEDSTTGYWEGKQKQYPHERAGTRKVKGKRPDAWGLYDMLGNVWEWTQDTWHENYKGAPADGSAWETDKAGAYRVIRGGSWSNDARYCRSAYRYQNHPDNRYDDIGFRCARV